jgi:hypothetical protein
MGICIGNFRGSKKHQYPKTPTIRWPSCPESTSPDEIANDFNVDRDPVRIRVDTLWLMQQVIWKNQKIILSRLKAHKGHSLRVEKVQRSSVQCAGVSWRNLKVKDSINRGRFLMVVAPSAIVAAVANVSPAVRHGVWRKIEAPNQTP